MVRWLWELFVVWRYMKAGLALGDADSYSFLGKAVGYDDMEARLLKWQRRYEALGYRPISRNSWMLAGGYGKSISDELFKPASA